MQYPPLPPPVSSYQIAGSPYAPANTNRQPSITRASSTALPANRISEENPGFQANSGSKNQMEATVRLLIERNKSLEAEATQRIEAADGEIERLQMEIIGLRRQNNELSQRHGSADETMAALRDQTAEGKRMAAQLLKENEGFGSRMEVLEREAAHLKGLLDAAYRSEEEIQAAYDDVCDKLSKADRHIRQLCDDAATKSIQFLAMQNELSEAKELKENGEQLKQELLRHITKALYGLAEEAELLIVESDELSIKTRLALTVTTEQNMIGSLSSEEAGDSHRRALQSQLDKLKTTKAALRSKYSRGDKHTAASSTPTDDLLPLRCLPEGILSLQQLTQFVEGNEAVVVSVSTGIIDGLALVRDDIAVTFRAIDEEGALRRHNISRHFRSLEDAVASERAHSKQLIAELDAQNATIKSLEEERLALKKALDEMDAFMANATKLSESSAERLSGCVEDKQRAEREAKAAKETTTSLQTEMAKQTKLIAELSAQVEHWRWIAQQRESDIDNGVHQKRRAEESIAELKIQIDSLQAQNRSQKSETEDVSERLRKTELELSVSRKQVLEAESQNRILQGKLKSAEAELKNARDDIADANHRADKSLLRPRGSSVMTSVPRAISPIPLASTTTVASSSTPLRTAAPIISSRPPLPVSSAPQTSLLHSPPSKGVYQSTISEASPSVYRHDGGMMVAADGITFAAADGVVPNGAAVLATTSKYDEWESKLNGLLQKSQVLRTA